MKEKRTTRMKRQKGKEEETVRREEFFLSCHELAVQRDHKREQDQASSSQVKTRKTKEDTPPLDTAKT